MKSPSPFTSCIGSPPSFLAAATVEHLRHRVLEAEIGVFVADALVFDEQLRRQHRERIRHGPAQALVHLVLDLRGAQAPSDLWKFLFEALSQLAFVFLGG